MKNNVKFGYIIVIIAFGFLLSNCSKNKNHDENNDILFKMQDSICTLRNKVLLGDTLAYINLKKIFDSYYEYPQEFFLYSIIMANDFHYPSAYFDVYQYLTGIYNGEFNKMDKDSKELAILHLRRGAKLNNKSCKKALERLQQ